MKKFLIISAVLATFAFTSCKKEYTCNCVDAVAGTEYTETAKGKDATDACNDASKPLQFKVCTPAE